MSEPLTERLSRFTPDTSGLDRDALLFAAGRASARPNRRWMAIAGTFAAAQLVTLVLLWPSPRPADSPVAGSRTPPIADSAPAPPPAAPGSLAALRESAVTAEGNLPPTAASDNLVSPDPPLHAFAASWTWTSLLD